MSKLLSVLIFVFSFVAASVFSAADLTPPTIAINPDIYYPLDEVLYIEGRAVPNATVQINFQKSGAKPINVVTKSDANGEWVFAEQVPLDAGNWEVRARITEQERTSSWSNPRILKAIVNGVILGGITIKFTLLVLIILLLLVMGGGAVWYLLWRVRRIRAEQERVFLEKEKESAISLVEKNFIELRQKISDELEHIEKRLAGGSLTEEEKEHREHLLREFKEVEQAIEKKIKNME